MDKVEVPPFLLSYFDSHTIRTPISTIMGYSQAILKGVDGPLNEDLRKDVEVIQKNAEWLFEYWGFAIKIVRYLADEHEIHPRQVSLNDLINQCTEAINRYSSASVEVQIPNEPRPVRADLLDSESIFACIGKLTGNVYGRASGRLIVRVSQSLEATVFEFELDQTESTKKEDAGFFIEPYIFVIDRVMKLHGGESKLTNTPDEKLLVSLTFPDMPQSKPNL